MPDYPLWCEPDDNPNFGDNRCTTDSALDANLPNWCIFEGNWTNSQCQSDVVHPINQTGGGDEGGGDVGGGVSVETGAVVETVPNIQISQQIFAQQLGFIISILIGFAIIKMLTYRKPRL